MYIEITEGGSSSPVHGLTTHEILRLRAASGRWRHALRLPREPLSIQEVGEGTVRIATVDVAGFVKVGAVSIDIAPKYLDRDTAGPGWRTAMWRFLAYGEGQELLDDGASSAISDGQGIADVLADVFLKSVLRGHTMGYPLGYRSAAEDSRFMRGRLDERRLNHLSPFTGTVPVVSSRLSRDTELNRLLKWAALRLARLVERPSRRKRLVSWAKTLSEVADQTPSPTSISVPKRQYPHLVPATEIALLLLSDLSGTFGASSFDVPGFLWRSDDLFERAMRRLVADAARPLGLSVAKRTHRLLRHQANGRERFTVTTPDIDVFSAKGSVVILDAKYMVSPQDPSSDNTYQVMAAGRVAGVECVGLVFPTAGVGMSQRVSYEPVGAGLPNELALLEVGLLSFSDRRMTRKTQDQFQAWLRGKIGASGATGAAALASLTST